MRENIFVREYHDEDHDLVYSLILSIIESEYRDIPPDSYLFDIDHFHDVYNGSRDAFWVVEQNSKNRKKIIGTIAIKEDDENTALLRRFFVSPRFRSKGVGKRLFETTLEFCRNNHYKEIIFIGNNKMNKVNKFLKKRNFQDLEVIDLKKEKKDLFGVYKLSFKC